MDIIENLLPYNERLQVRDPSRIDLIVVHCTELPTLQMAREFGERVVHPESQSGNSGHYYIDRDGKVYRYVEDNRIAHHVIGYNPTSIGIEIVNAGRYPKWYSAQNQIPSEPYAPAQIGAVKELLCFLKGRIPHLERIARHSDLDTEFIPAEDDPDARIRRKVDPGPLFPWDEILDFWRKL